MSHRSGVDFRRIYSPAGGVGLRPPAPVYLGRNSHFANSNPKGSATTHATLLDLAALLHRNNVSQVTAKDVENRPYGAAAGVPAGYTYLLQLVAHDLVLTAEEIGNGPAGYNHKGNLRRVQFQLETLFGGGPKVCPHIFDRDDSGWHKLRLGNFRDIQAAAPPWSGPTGELGRVVFSAQGDPNLGEGAMHDALLADPRNDDNPILAQLTVLFLKLFNHLSPPATKIVSDDNWRNAAGETVNIFRRLVLKDLLPRILMPQILQYYQGRPRWLDGERRNGSVSFEFAFAAGRIAHAMIRPVYQLNDAVRVELSDLLKADKYGRPMRQDWKIDWSLFFTDAPEAAPPRFNWASRFGLKMAFPMHMAVSALAPDLNGQTAAAGVVFRDLLRGEDMGVMRPADFAALVQGRESPLAGIGCLQNLLDPVLREAVVRQGLTALDTEGLLGPRQIDELAKAPPLLLYLMLEAQDCADGRTLGPLGSVLFAEAFRKVFQDGKRTVGYPVGPLEAKKFGAAGIQTMARLAAAL
jgi:hypothetical protein